MASVTPAPDPPPIVHSGAARPLRTYLSPLAMAANLWSHRDLIWQLTRRDVRVRYQTTHLGLLWAILTPLVLLTIYTFVFAIVFQSRWSIDPSTQESTAEFALTMFCGMLLWNMFAEVVGRAPTMIVYNPNYVKKVVFPLEVFVVAGLGSALFNMLISYGVWLVGWALIKATWPPLTLVWLPVVLVPITLITCGVAWFLASLGVFIRDIGPSIQLALQVLFFATPIFYPIDRLPRPYRTILEFNPLSHCVGDARRVMMYGQAPDWAWWAPTLAGAVVLAVLGYGFFMKSKRAFADVI